MENISYLRNNVLFYGNQLFGDNVELLPVIVRDIVGTCPANRQEAAFFSIMPVLSVYSSRMLLKYPYDNVLSLPALHVYVIGDTSSGKGTLDGFQRLLAQPLKELDDANRRLEDAYEDEMKTKAVTQKAPPKPKTVVLCLPASTSKYKILERAKAIKRRYNDTALLFYSDTPEIDLVSQAYKTGFADIRPIVRLSYDYGAEYGAEHGGDGAHGRVDINMSLCYFGTLSAMASFFNKTAILGGTLNRSIIVNLENKIGDPISQYTKLTQGQMETINHYLNSMLGSVFVDNEQSALQPIRFLPLDYLAPYIDSFFECVRSQFSLFSSTDQWTIETFARRSSVSAFRVAAVCNNLFNIENKLSTDEVEQRTIMIYNYAAYFILTSVLNTFGNRISGHRESEEKMRAKEEKLPLFDALPAIFTLNDVCNLCSQKGLLSKPSNRISAWKADGLIKKVGENRYKKILKLFSPEAL